MPKSTTDILKSFAWPTYFVAALLIATPAVDYLTNVWPVRVSDVGWRYGSVGLLAGFLLTPLFGVLFALGAAIVLEHRLVLRVFSILNVVIAVFLILLIVFFALDVVQVRATIPDDATAEARSMFLIGAVKSALKYLTLAFGLGWLGIVGLRATRLAEGEKRTLRKSTEVPLVRSSEATQNPREESASGSEEQ